MSAFWTEPDFDDHELVEYVHDAQSGLTALIALHSTHLGPGAGGTRFWHYPDPSAAMRDALRLSRGMSYKNAMAGLPVGGGKGVILAGPERSKTPGLMAAYARAIDSLGGRYVTAEDVGMTEADMIAIGAVTPHVAGLPAREPGAVGGSPGPSTATGVFLGIAAAVVHGMGRDSLEGVHVAVQGVGSVGGGVAQRLVAAGARVTLADVDQARAEALARSLGLDPADAVVPANAIMDVESDVFSPNALGAILDDAGIARLRAGIVAGGANNQLARPEHGRTLAARGVLYAPDYVINAGGIIAVTLEYLARTRNEHWSQADLDTRLREIPDRLRSVWAEAEASGETADAVADAMARQLIGR